jgi:hypothetical protein
MRNELRLKRLALSEPMLRRLVELRPIVASYS